MHSELVHVLMYKYIPVSNSLFFLVNGLPQVLIIWMFIYSSSRASFIHKDCT